jgi:hypothetical protein
MRQRHGSPLLIAILGLLVMIASGAGAAVIAPPCGGATPCDCGNRVIASRTLTPADPVTTTVCTGNGLFVAGGVTLDLGGRTITGDGMGADVGITIEGGAANAIIQNGRVTGFGTGVATFSTATSSTLATLRIYGNGTGIRINAHHTDIKNSWVFDNTGVGYDLDGSHLEVTQNRSTYNGDDGFHIEGSGHTVTLNYAASNAGNGYTVSATGSHFDRNRSAYNDGWGIEEIPPAGGNTYSANRCTANGLGKSTPAGLGQ